MVGRAVERLYPERPTGHGDVVLEVRGLRRLPEVRSVSLELRAGEVVGLGGLVGAGRTELLRLIYGLDQPDEGEVYVDGDAPAAEPAGPGHRGGARVRARGPQVAGPAARLEPHQERQPGGPRALPARPAQRARRAVSRRGAPARAPHRARRPGPHRARALGRKPAEGGARPLAPAPLPRAAPRRAHPRRGRGDQGRALPRDHRSGRGGPGGARGLVGARGADGDLQPDPRDAGGRARLRDRRREATEQELLRHAVVPTDSADFVEEVR